MDMEEVGISEWWRERQGEMWTIGMEGDGRLSEPSRGRDQYSDNFAHTRRRHL